MKLVKSDENPVNFISLLPIFSELLGSILIDANILYFNSFIFLFILCIFSREYTFLCPSLGLFSIA